MLASLRCWGRSGDVARAAPQRSVGASRRLRQMRLGRIASPDGVAFVSIEGELDDPTGMTVREIAEHPFGTPTFTGRSWPLADVRLLAPILASKVVCVGKNYADHIAEMGGQTGPAPADPVIFLKPNTAIVGPNVPIRLPANASPVHFEGELAVVIGQAVQRRLGRRGRGQHPRLHHRQRRVGARSAEGRRPVDAREGSRHASVRSGRGSSPMSTRPTWNCAPRSTARSNRTAAPR